MSEKSDTARPGPLRTVAQRSLLLWAFMTALTGALGGPVEAQIGLTAGAALAVANFLLQGLTLRGMLSHRDTAKVIMAALYPARYVLVGLATWLVLSNAEALRVQVAAFLGGLSVIYLSISLGGLMDYVSQRRAESAATATR